MKFTFWDLKEGMKFTAPGKGRVEYIINSFDNNTSGLTRVKDNEAVRIATPKLLEIMNQSEISDQSKEKPMTTTSKILGVKTALKTTAQEPGEKPPLKPYKPLKKAPPKFPYEERTLMPPDDARRVSQTLTALNDRAKRIKDIDTKAKEMRVQVEDKVKTYQVGEGYEELKQEAQSFTEKLAEEVEEVGDRVGDVLLEYNNTVLGVYETVSKGKVTNKELQATLIAKINEFASSGVAGKIIAAADEALAEIEKAKEMVSRNLASWPPPEDLRKKVKQELPKGAGLCVMADGVIDTIKSFVSKAVDWLQGVWTTVSDKLSGLVSSVDQAEPLVSEMKTLLGQVTTGNKEKGGSENMKREKTSDYRSSGDIFENRHEYADAMIDAFTAGEEGGPGLRDLFNNLVLAMSDSEAFANFDHIAQMYDFYPTKDKLLISADEFQERYNEDGTPKETEPQVEGEPV